MNEWMKERMNEWIIKRCFSLALLFSRVFDKEYLRINKSSPFSVRHCSHAATLESCYYSLLCFVVMTLELLVGDHVVVACRTVRESWTRQQDARRMSSVSTRLPCFVRQVRVRTANAERDAGQPGQTTHRATRCLQPAAGDQTRRRDIDRRRGDAAVRRQSVPRALAVLRLWRCYPGLPRCILTVLSFRPSAPVDSGGSNEKRPNGRPPLGCKFFLD